MLLSKILKNFLCDNVIFMSRLKLVNDRVLLLLSRIFSKIYRKFCGKLKISSGREW